MAIRAGHLIAGGVATGGVAAGAAATGLAALRRAAAAARSHADPHAGESFGSVRGRELTVTADDGATLHVEVDEPDRAASVGAAPTVVLAHGWTLCRECWHFQRRALRGRARVVCYDQRGHGRSATARPSTYTVRQLGRDLATVLEAAAPDGPVVLAGHSMGGMTIMSLARHRPDLIARQVRGVVLVSTSYGRLAEVTLGLPALVAAAVRHATPRVMAALARGAERLEPYRGAGSDVSFLLTKAVCFGSAVPPSLIAFTERMIADTPLDVLAEFHSSLMEHDELEALPALRAVPTRVLVGEHDRLTPVEHSERIVDELPHARLDVLPGAGHMLMLERPDAVTGALLELAYGDQEVSA